MDKSSLYSDTNSICMCDQIEVTTNVYKTCTTLLAK